jgi:CRISPR-associated exonuclease Cas4
MSEAGDFIAISALQHWVFCPRQAALIHNEREWSENTLTALGQVLHQRTNEPGTDIRRGVKTCRALRICSEREGIAGVADCVEFRPDDTVVPVETKRGVAGQRLADQVQLCAQALCLEEMLGTQISTGELFYGASRKRVVVAIDEKLRATTRAAVVSMRTLIERRLLPPPEYGKKCRQCSLFERCQPVATARATAASSYIERLLQSPGGAP